MFLAPIKALYSMKFYTNYMLKSAWKALLFLAYLFIITAILMAGLTFFTGRPAVNRAIDTVAKYTPEMVLENGKLTVNNDMPLEIEPAELGGYKILFDTGRDEPVYPTQMNNDNIVVLATGDTIYYAFQGTFQSTPIPDETNVVINPQVIEQNREAAGTFVLYMIAIMTVLLQLLRIPFMVLLAFIVVALMNGFVRARISAATLLKIACYLQAPAILLALINFVSPIKIPLIFFVYIILFAVYSQFILNDAVNSGIEEAATEAGPRQIEESQEEQEEETEEHKEEEEDDSEDKKEI